MLFVVAVVGCFIVLELSLDGCGVSCDLFAQVYAFGSKGLVYGFHERGVYVFESFGAYAFVEPVPNSLIAWFPLEAQQLDGFLVELLP